MLAYKLLEWINPDKIDWRWLSHQPKAIRLLEANPEKINWDQLSRNPSAIHLLEANQDKIHWYRLHNNPAIFTYDYDQLRVNKLALNREAIEYCYHPDRVEQYLEIGE